MQPAMLRPALLLCFFFSIGCGDSDSQQSANAHACKPQFEENGISGVQTSSSLLALRLESPTTKTPHKNDTHTEPGVDAVVYSLPIGGALRFRNEHSDSVTLNLLGPNGNLVGTALNGGEVHAENLPAGKYTLEMRNTGDDAPLFLVPEGCPKTPNTSNVSKDISSITATTIAPVSPQTYATTLETVERLIELTTNMYVFQSNNQITWNAVINTLSNELETLRIEGVILGTGGSDSYSVACGLGTTMTSLDILNGVMNVSVQVAILRPAEFTVLTFQQLMQTS